MLPNPFDAFTSAAFPPRAPLPRPRPLRPIALTPLGPARWLCLVPGDTRTWRVVAWQRPGDSVPVPRHASGELARCADCALGRHCPTLEAGRLACELDTAATLEAICLRVGMLGVGAAAGARARSLAGRLGRLGCRMEETQ